MNTEPGGTEADRDRAAQTITGNLMQRRVIVRDDDDPETLADLLSAVERFEREVALRGGDSMTNAPDSHDPDREDFVLPVRKDGESAEEYSRRVDAAAQRMTGRAD